jgi:hypothetical protein
LYGGVPSRSRPLTFLANSSQSLPILYGDVPGREACCGLNYRQTRNLSPSCMGMFPSITKPNEPSVFQLAISPHLVWGCSRRRGHGSEWDGLPCNLSPSCMGVFPPTPRVQTTAELAISPHLVWGCSLGRRQAERGRSYSHSPSCMGVFP